MGDRRIRHPIPRRHTYLARQFIDTIDGATLVGTENHQLSLVYEDEILFPFALQQLGLLRIFLGDLAFSYCSYHDGSILTARHATQVMAQVSDSHLHSLPVGRTIADGILRARQEKGIFSRSLVKLYKLFGCIHSGDYSQQHTYQQDKFLHKINCLFFVIVYFVVLRCKSSKRKGTQLFTMFLLLFNLFH